MKDIVSTLVLFIGTLALGTALGVYIGQDTCARPAHPAVQHTRVQV